MATSLSSPIASNWKPPMLTLESQLLFYQAFVGKFIRYRSTVVISGYKRDGRRVGKVTKCEITRAARAHYEAPLPPYIQITVSRWQQNGKRRSKRKLDILLPDDILETLEPS